MHINRDRKMGSGWFRLVGVAGITRGIYQPRVAAMTSHHKAHK